MNIKILTSYHKKCALVSSEIIRPIQVGTSINGTAYSDTLHDNTGINISDKNRMYCELTAQYWRGKILRRIIMVLCTIVDTFVFLCRI